jgi:hypothetical protein
MIISEHSLARRSATNTRLEFQCLNNFKYVSQKLLCIVSQGQLLMLAHGQVGCKMGSNITTTTTTAVIIMQLALLM